MTKYQKLAKQYAKEKWPDDEIAEGHQHFDILDFARWLDQEEDKTIQNPKEICNQIVQSTILGEIRCVNKKPCFLHDILKDQQEDKKEKVEELKREWMTEQRYTDMEIDRIINKINQIIRVLNKE